MLLLLSPSLAASKNQFFLRVPVVVIASFVVVVIVVVAAIVVVVVVDLFFSFFCTKIEFLAQNAKTWSQQETFLHQFSSRPHLKQRLLFLGCEV